ncbi:hypothetical protein [Clostridium estertheticum]|uniref:hypothetical protein n=1 Tax=Clostridium estertheticum TaxID=238834 RepID=UPI00129D11CE|nr:hypothetical protein [Clostridium estertheticum]
MHNVQLLQQTNALVPIGEAEERLQQDYIRVETKIKITETGFGVDELKIKDWTKAID